MQGIKTTAHKKFDKRPNTDIEKHTFSSFFANPVKFSPILADTMIQASIFYDIF